MLSIVCDKAVVVADDVIDDGDIEVSASIRCFGKWTLFKFDEWLGVDADDELKLLLLLMFGMLFEDEDRQLLPNDVTFSRDSVKRGAE